MTRSLTTKEVSEKLNLGINQTRDIIKRKDFPKITYGRKWIIPEDEFDKWVARNIGKRLK